MRPSTDYDAIKKIFSDESVFDLLTDDNTPRDFEVPQGVGYLLSDERDGVVMLVPRNSVEVECHICVLPSAKHKAYYYGERSLAYLFKETNCQKATAMIPEHNKQVYKYCMKLGFKQEGVNRKSFLKNGKLQDQNLVGLTKEEWLCHH